MTYDELQKKTAEVYASDEVYTSPDFQCDQTGGFPTSLCVCWEKQKAWLELNENLLMDRDDTELGYYKDLCADYGIRSCCDIEDFNRLLRGLGEDAIRTAELFPDEDESITMGGMEIAMLIIGLLLGGCVSFCILGCMQINRINDYEDEIRRLRAKEKTETE